MLARERAKRDQAALVEQRKRWEKGDFSQTKKEIRAAEQKLLEAGEEEEDDNDNDGEDDDEESESDDKPVDSVGLKLIKEMSKGEKKDKGREALNTPTDGYIKNLVDVSVYLFVSIPNYIFTTCTFIHSKKPVATPPPPLYCIQTSIISCLRD
jgi:hypothetical protein